MTTNGMKRGFSARMRASSLGAKLVLLIGAVTVLVVAAAFLTLRARVEADVRHVFVGELSASQQTLRSQHDRNLHLLFSTSSLVSMSPVLRAALGTLRIESNAGLASNPEGVATLQTEAERILADVNSDLLIITDDSGRVVAATGPAAPERGTSLMSMPAVRHALTAQNVQPDSSFGVLRGSGFGPPLQVGAVPIDLHGFPVAVLILGEGLDKLLPQLGASENTNVIVTLGDSVALTTLDDVSVGDAWTAGTPAESDGTMRLRIGGDDYLAASMPLGSTYDGRRASLYLVRSLSASLRPITGSLGRSFLFIGVLAVLVAGIGAALVARASLRPLWRFVGFMRTGAETGEYARFADGPVPSEIATLTGTYNRLIDSVHAQHTQLQHRSAELALAIDGLRAEVRERERAEQALRESEEQLRQSQKLEALGTLAGGVAHDFNNMLSVILGFAQLSLQELPEDSPARADVGEIVAAGERAAALVRQLLAFSRKQVLQPQLMDLNQTVSALEPMLRRLIREDVVLRIKLSTGIARIMADRGQIEQVLLNLVVNARDAMPNGGTLTVETAQVELDDQLTQQADSKFEGTAIELTVSDTGMGMDAATRARIFEPFFTTKAEGKGTGLGLSTVYGIVRQSGGIINVISEPGKGCMFKIHFPAVVGAAAQGDTLPAQVPAPRGEETVLLAEDDPQLRTMMQRSLKERGYRVLEASDGREAFDVAMKHPAPIHLLLSDVVMPHLSGLELAELLRVDRPALRVLFMSGYSDEAIERNGVLAPGTRFLQKPVTPAVLVRAVRAALDADDVEPAWSGTES